MKLYHKRFVLTNYELFPEHLTDSESGDYVAYGIRAVKNGRSVLAIGDISAEKDKVAALVRKFNTEQLSPEHLNEAVEDFLYDFEV